MDYSLVFPPDFLYPKTITLSGHRIPVTNVCGLDCAIMELVRVHSSLRNEYTLDMWFMDLQWHGNYFVKLFLVVPIESYILWGFLFLVLQLLKNPHLDK